MFDAGTDADADADACTDTDAGGLARSIEVRGARASAAFSS